MAPVPPVVAYKLTVLPTIAPVSPRTPDAVIVPVAVQVPLTRQYFCMEGDVVSSVIYRVSTPTTPASKSAKKKAFGLPLVGKPGGLVMVCPLVVGVPIPTAPIRKALPAPVDTYSWPPNILTWRKFVCVVLSWVEVVEPNIA